MAIIRGITDTLDAEVRKFDQTPLPQPVLLNSIPKGGTHLLRNILRMFAPVEQHYQADFVQVPNMHLHLDAFNPHRPMLSAGHLLFSDQSAANIRHARHILLVRDPHAWVLARLRFFLSDAFDQENIAHLKSGVFSADQLINMMIFGIHQKSPALIDIYTHNAVAWLGTGVHLVRYEDLLRAANNLDDPASERLIGDLLESCRVTRPDDWRDRVRIGADPRLSRTARANLVVQTAIDIPDALTPQQQALVEFHAPGLRALLGYA
jgi:hypothetical protein